MQLQIASLVLLLSFSAAAELDCNTISPQGQEIDLQEVTRVLKPYENKDLCHEERVTASKNSYRTYELKAKVGDEVLLSRPYPNLGRYIYKIIQISDENLFLLEDCRWYGPHYLSQLVEEKRGIAIGQTVAIRDWRNGGIKLHKIKRIAKFIQPDLITMMQFEDDSWMRYDNIMKLKDKHRGIRVGDNVKIGNSDIELLSVQAITDEGDYLLENGKWYKHQEIDMQ